MGSGRFQVCGTGEIPLHPRLLRKMKKRLSTFVKQNLQNCRIFSAGFISQRSHDGLLQANTSNQQMIF
jgi:hypothetical protein